MSEVQVSLGWAIIMGMASAGVAFGGCGSSGSTLSESTSGENTGGDRSGSGGRSHDAAGAESESSAGTNSSGSANLGGGAGTVGNADLACPEIAPSVDDPCSADGTQCSFGDSPFPECRAYLVCFSGTWSKGAGPSSCSPTAATICPASAPTSGEACDAALVGSRCSFSSGALCNCVKEACGGAGCTALPHPQWACGQPMPSCPKQAPNAGTACGNMPVGCQYEYCGLTAMCQDGRWKWLFGCA